MIVSEDAFVNGEQVLHSDLHSRVYDELKVLMSDSPAFQGRHWNRNLLTFLTPANFARVLYLSEIYKKIVEVPGVVIEAGVLYGSTTSSFLNLRSIYEPYNHTRRIVSFDTFEGFVDVTSKDPSQVGIGDYATSEGWLDQLENILNLNEQISPLNHLKKYEIIKGDISETLPIWLNENPGVTVALLHLDLDLYEPTLNTLDHLQSRLVRGSVIAFDEFSDKSWPGETIAFLEKFDLSLRNIRRSTLQNNAAYLVVD